MPTSVPPSNRSNGDRQGKRRQKLRLQAKHDSYLKPQLFSVRLWLIWGFLVAVAMGLGVQLFRLQVLHGAELSSKAKKQQVISLRPFIPRRPVIDRVNNVLAIDRPVYTLYAHPKLFKKSSAEVAKKLSSLLQRPAGELENKFNSRDTGLRLAPVLGEEVAEKISKLRLDGLELIEEYSRFYPQKDLVGDVVGYVNLDRSGQAGVEYSQQKWLERSINTVKLNRRGDGALMSDRSPAGFLHVDDLRLQLTIDTRLQRASRLRLKEQLQKFGAKRGSAIVMDAKDGAILTMVSYPSYDPNTYAKADFKLFKNWALSDLYEPGSTFKPINVAIALDSGVIQPDSVFADPDVITVGGWPISNAEKEDRYSLSVAGILQYSSNVGMVQIMQRMKPVEYYKWLQKIELNKPLGIDLPFETAGQIKDRNEFISSPIEPATTSFGQGFSLTPIKLVQLVAALANGGKLVTPHVVAGLVDAKGKSHWQPPLPAEKQLFSPKTTQEVVKMMEKVVKEGTGKAAQIPGYRLAGKTGTAQKASPTGRGYSSGAKITSFVSIFPVEAPRYVVLVVIDEPKGIAFGSTTAAPVVKSIIESLIAIERIPPSQPIAVKASPSPQVSRD
ncbi:peptidoglycan D,D-transpeptidase FtsI family protein [Chlorogloea sp. CCALA 695]|uniref:peptidoglycan D,D-transpeptidase FtsI family protein n=1 Tax=Chlorogloea sp. CCALA 695 TaxID=2107693 RepID=UPI000D07AEF3|nr:penicillin-binding protein 2 [Chlorogloea sp. CCALA 695]PSB32778.1 cell division protein FtsI [Chlorogloea sp. CCALA 695]